MLDNETFKTVVASKTLVSIDLVFVCNDQMLVGLRNNEPLKGKWFTPGGGIAKDERWQDALTRMAKAELGLDISSSDCTVIGVYAHFHETAYPTNEIHDRYVD